MPHRPQDFFGEEIGRTENRGAIRGTNVRRRTRNGPILNNTLNDFRPRIIQLIRYAKKGPDYQLAMLSSGRCRLKKAHTRSPSVLVNEFYACTLCAERIA